MESKRVLLTGGAGFIGHHTVEHFLETTDWEIVVIDSLTYAGDVGRLTDIEGYDPDRVDIHWHDLRAPIGEWLDKRIGHIDAVVNMASSTHVSRSIDDPVPFVKGNIDIVLNMLEWARTRDLEAFVQVSTDEVYGAATKGQDFKEWDRHVPSNPYAASKSGQEALAIAYWRTYDIPVVITNTMNNYGERQHPEKFVPLIVKLLSSGEQVKVHAAKTADGWEAGTRMWLHARNHADAIKFILENVEPVMFPDADKPERFNVVGDEEIANDEVVERIAEVMGVEPNYEYVNYYGERPGHDARYSLDGSKLAEAGWEAPLSTQQALRNTIEWMMENQEWHQ